MLGNLTPRERAIVVIVVSGVGLCFDVAVIVYALLGWR